MHPYLPNDPHGEGWINYEKKKKYTKFDSKIPYFFLLKDNVFTQSKGQYKSLLNLSTHLKNLGLFEYKNKTFLCCNKGVDYASIKGREQQLRSRKLYYKDNSLITANMFH